MYTVLCHNLPQVFVTFTSTFRDKHLTDIDVIQYYLKASFVLHTLEYPSNLCLNTKHVPSKVLNQGRAYW